MATTKKTTGTTAATKKVATKKTSKKTVETAEKTVEAAETPSYPTLEVTKVEVFPFKGGMSLGKIKAMASVVLNDQLQIRGLRVYDGINGLFVGYPCDPFFKGEENRYVCVPTTSELRAVIEKAVLDKFNEVK